MVGPWGLEPLPYQPTFIKKYNDVREHARILVLSNPAHSLRSVMASELRTIACCLVLFLTISSLCLGQQSKSAGNPPARQNLRSTQGTKGSELALEQQLNLQKQQLQVEQQWLNLQQQQLDVQKEQLKFQKEQ